MTQYIAISVAVPSEIYIADGIRNIFAVNITNKRSMHLEVAEPLCLFLSAKVDDIFG